MTNDKQLPYPLTPDSLLNMLMFYSCIPVDLLDCNKRPILEGRSIYNKPNISDYRVCMYRGSREKHANMMNFGALKYTSKCFKKCLCIIRCLSFLSNEQESKTEQEYSQARRLYKVAFSGLKSINYYLARSYVFDEEYFVQEDYASLSKLSHGLTHMLYSAPIKYINDNLEQKQFDEIYEFIDESGLLIGEVPKEVCAGSPSMIKEVLKFSLCEISNDINFKDNDINNVFNYASLTSIFEVVASFYNIYKLLTHHSRDFKGFKHTLPNGNMLFEALKLECPFRHYWLVNLRYYMWFNFEYEYLEPHVNEFLNLLQSFGYSYCNYEKKSKIEEKFLFIMNDLNRLLAINLNASYRPKLITQTEIDIVF